MALLRGKRRKKQNSKGKSFLVDLMARKKEYDEIDFSELPPWAQLFVLLCVLGVFIYVFVPSIQRDSFV